MKTNIAIVGLSCTLPGVNDFEDSRKLVSESRVLIHELSQQRLADVEARFGKKSFMKGGYLERIDLFDNEFFGITSQEALYMDPVQRMTLEQTVKAIYNAGIHPTEVTNLHAGYYFVQDESDYSALFDHASNIALSTQLPGMAATRVAQFLDIRGPVVGINTSCSSSLTMLHTACNALRTEECDLAIAGGVKLSAVLKETVQQSPILSKTERCLPFDAEADGTIIGEGAIFLVLKRVEDAVANNDFIYACIRGSALNHAGSRLRDLTAPSDEAQTELILKAWKNADVTGRDIGFVEAHGTGTFVGDPIEYSGIVNAFEASESKNGSCSISSIKGQVGHLDTLSGLAGVVRAIVALRDKILPGQGGFSRLNPCLLPNKAIKVHPLTSAWNPRFGKRCAGVSSFGLTGTNAHVVLEEFDIETETTRDWAVTTLAFSSLEEMTKTCDYLFQYVQRRKRVNLRDLINYLNRIYRNGQYRKAFFSNSRLKFINNISNKATENVVLRNKKEKVNIILLGTPNFEKKDIIAFVGSVYGLDKIWNYETNSVVEQIEDVSSWHYNILFIRVLIKFLKNTEFIDVSLSVFSESATNNTLYTGNVSSKELLLLTSSVNSGKGDYKRLTRYIQVANSTEDYFVIDEPKGKGLSIISKADVPFYPLISAKEELPNALAALFRKGFQLKNHKRPECPPEIQLPVFDKKRFWPESKHIAQPQTTVDNTTPAIMLPVNNLASIVQTVAEIWMSNLGLNEEIKGSADFFTLGGNSLLGLDVLSDIEKSLGVTLAYQDIFDYPTLEELAKRIYLTLSPTRSTNFQKSHELIVNDTHREFEYNNISQNLTSIKVTRVNTSKILVTGATGFVGVFIVRELIAETEAQIYCLIRGEDAEKRFEEHFLSFFPKMRDALEKRIIVVYGDIFIPDLGITEENIELLSDIDTVFHCAANVAHFGSANNSERANVEGTKNVFTWATKHERVRFNHISSLSVIGNFVPGIEEVDFYETDLDIGQEFRGNVYGQSKFNAEGFLSENASASSDLKIFRLGNLAGVECDGAFQKNIYKNSIYLFFKTLAEFGMYPAEYLEHTVEILPIDIVTRAVVAIALCDHCPMTTFHLFNPRPYQIEEVIHTMRSLSLAIDIRPNVELQQFIDSGFYQFSKENTALGLLRYSGNNMPHTHFNIKSIATLALLDKLSISINFDRDHYLNTILQYCLKEGFITL